MATAPTSSPTGGAAAFSVLTNAQLFQNIVSWPDGWPALVALRWREIKAARTEAQLYEFKRKTARQYEPRKLDLHYFMWELILGDDRRTLELTKRVRTQRFRIEFGTLRVAIRAGNADALRLAHGFSEPATVGLSVEAWGLAISCFNGRLDVLEVLHSLEPLNEADVRSNARQHLSTWYQPVEKITSVRLVAWLIEKVGPGCLSSKMLHSAALTGSLELVRFLNAVAGQYIQLDTFVQVYRLMSARPFQRLKFLSVLDFLLQHRRENDTRELEGVSLAACDYETLSLILRTRGALILHAEIIDTAASRGDLEAIKLLTVNSTVLCKTSAMDGAATSGHLDVVVFLHDTRTEGCTTAAMDGAAGNGYLEVVRFLHKNRQEGCTTRAMDAAAAGGFLDVVRFLHNNRHEGCTTEALDRAAQNGHLSVVQFLHENRREGCSEEAFTYPHPTGKRTAHCLRKAETQRSTLLYMLQYRTEMHSKKLEQDTFHLRDLEVLTAIQRSRGLQFLRDVSIDTLAAEGNVGLIKFLVEHVPVVCTTAAMDAAAANNHLDVVKYLYETREEGCTTMAMDMAANANHWEVVAFLDEHRNEGCTVVLLNAAVRLGRLDLVQRYCSRVPQKSRGAAVVVAGVYGHDDIQNFLRKSLKPTS